MRGAWSFALAFTVACTGPATGAGTGTRPSFVRDDRFCVPEAWTMQLPPDRQAPVSDPVGACGNHVNGRAMKENPIACGPCGFVLDGAVTRAAREHMPDACCYEVSSPPPPPPPPTPDPDPRFACGKNGDCLASCRHGAVSVAWHRATYPGEEGCEDGCTSKETQPPMCVNGSCVARRDDADDPGCTHLDVPPLAGPGPAHACGVDADCVADCALGAVNAGWLRTQSEHVACKDGCTSKGTEAPRCEDHACVAYRAGARDDGCTRRSVRGE